MPTVTWFNVEHPYWKTMDRFCGRKLAQAEAKRLSEDFFKNVRFGSESSQTHYVYTIEDEIYIGKGRLEPMFIPKENQDVC